MNPHQYSTSDVLTLNIGNSSTFEHQWSWIDEHSFKAALDKKKIAVVAQGTMEVVPWKPFFIMTSNISKKPINLPEKTYVDL